MPYPRMFSFAFGADFTGLALRAQFVDSAGQNVGGAITAGFVDTGAGDYLFFAENVPDDLRGGLVISTTGGEHMATLSINPEDAAAIRAIKEKTDLLGMQGVVMVAPVTDGGRLILVRGDDYHADDGRAIEFTDTASVWPDITGADVKLTIASGLYGDSVPVDGTVESATKVSFNMTAAQTKSLRKGSHTYDVLAILDGSERRVRLTRGFAEIIEDITQ